MLDDPLFVRHANGMEPTRRALDLARPEHEALNDLSGALSPLRVLTHSMLNTMTVWEHLTMSMEIFPLFAGSPSPMPSHRLVRFTQHLAN